MGILKINKNFFRRGLRLYYLLFKVIMAGTLLWYVLTLLDLELLGSNLQKISLKNLFLAAGFCFFSLMVQTLRWCYMTKNAILGTLFQHSCHFWASNFFNLISPASLGGDIYRVVVYRNTGKGAALPLGFIVRERFLGLMGFCLSYLICLCFLIFNSDSSHSLSNFFIQLGWGFGIAFSLLTLIQFGMPFFLQITTQLLPQHWQIKVVIFSSSIRYKSPIECIVLILLTQTSILSWIVVYWVLAQSILDFMMPLEKLGLINVIAEIARWLPITIQGFGVREGVAAYGFELMNFKAEAGFLICALSYLINTLVLTLTGVTGILLLSIGSPKMGFRLADPDISEVKS